jgi:hypothetical protein
MPAADSMLPHLAMIPILLTFDRDKLCKIEVECAYQTFVQVDSDLLLYRQLRQHANRFVHSSISTCFAKQACRNFDKLDSPNRVSDEALQENGFTEPILTPVLHALHKRVEKLQFRVFYCIVLV